MKVWANEIRGVGVGVFLMEEERNEMKLLRTMVRRVQSVVVVSSFECPVRLFSLIFLDDVSKIIHIKLVRVWSTGKILTVRGKNQALIWAYLLSPDI